LDALKQAASSVDARARGDRRDSLERLAAVKKQDFYWLFLLTAIVWGFLFGRDVVLKLIEWGVL